MASTVTIVLQEDAADTTTISVLQARAVARDAARQLNTASLLPEETFHIVSVSVDPV